MMLVEITRNIFICIDEVASVQRECSRSETPSGGISAFSFDGSVVTLKNGRKIYVADMNPSQVLEKLKPSGGKGHE